MFVGIPGSGKTTFARQLASELQAVVLNSDSIRIGMWKNRQAIEATHANPAERKHANQLTFGAMNYATGQIIAAGHSVVYDCNANHHYERDEKHDIATKYDAISLVVRIKVPYEVSLDRVQNREESHDQRRMSPEKAKAVLDRFVREIEEPDDSERVIEISGEVSFEQQLQQFKLKLSQF